MTTIPSPALLAEVAPCWDEDGDLCDQQYRHSIAIDDVYAALLPEIVSDADGDEEVGAGVEEMSWQVTSREACEGRICEHGRADEQEPPVIGGKFPPEDG